jgi:hypothetical protein
VHNSRFNLVLVFIYTLFRLITHVTFSRRY